MKSSLWQFWRLTQYNRSGYYTFGSTHSIQYTWLIQFWKLHRFNFHNQSALLRTYCSLGKVVFDFNRTNSFVAITENVWPSLKRTFEEQLQFTDVTPQFSSFMMRLPRGQGPSNSPVVRGLVSWINYQIWQFICYISIYYLFNFKILL